MSTLKLPGARIGHCIVVPRAACRVTLLRSRRVPVAEGTSGNAREGGTRAVRAVTMTQPEARDRAEGRTRGPERHVMTTRVRAHSRRRQMQSGASDHRVARPREMMALCQATMPFTRLRAGPPLSAVQCGDRPVPHAGLRMSERRCSQLRPQCRWPRHRPFPPLLQRAPVPSPASAPERGRR